MMTPHLNLKFHVQTSTVLISITISLYIISTSYGLFYYCRGRLNSTQLETNCHRRWKGIPGEYSVSLAKNYFQHQSLLAEFLKSSTQLLKLKTV